MKLKYKLFVFLEMDWDTTTTTTRKKKRKKILRATFGFCLLKMFGLLVYNKKKAHRKINAVRQSYIKYM